MPAELTRWVKSDEGMVSDEGCATLPGAEKERVWVACLFQRDEQENERVYEERMSRWMLLSQTKRWDLMSVVL